MTSAAKSSRALRSSVLHWKHTLLLVVVAHSACTNHDAGKRLSKPEHVQAQPSPAAADAAPAQPRSNSASAPDAATVERAAAAPLKPDDCPEGMVYIPGGTFMMGLSKGGQRDLFESLKHAAPHQVTITRPYCIDKTEVTAGAYRKCSEAGACPSTANQCNGSFEHLLDHPANCLRWPDADAYCRWGGKRLPTEAEWEFAARGPKSFRHPWGNSKPDDSKLWYSGTVRRGFHTAPVGTHPKGASPFGVLDMEGNVAEFVADWEAHHPKQPQTDPVGPREGRLKVLKGSNLGSGVLSEDDLGDRYSEYPEMQGNSAIGFRCAK